MQRLVYLSVIGLFVFSCSQRGEDVSSVTQSFAEVNAAQLEAEEKAFAEALINFHAWELRQGNLKFYSPGQDAYPDSLPSLLKKFNVDYVVDTNAAWESFDVLEKAFNSVYGKDSLFRLIVHSAKLTVRGRYEIDPDTMKVLDLRKKMFSDPVFGYLLSPASSVGNNFGEIALAYNLDKNKFILKIAEDGSVSVKPVKLVTLNSAQIKWLFNLVKFEPYRMDGRPVTVITNERPL